MEDYRGEKKKEQGKWYCELVRGEFRLKEALLQR